MDFKKIGNMTIPALGKALFLGDIYNETTNTFVQQGILNMWLDLFSNTKKCEATSVVNQRSHTYFFGQPELCKWLHLGIGLHQTSVLLGSIAAKKSEYWFSDYLDYTPADNWAHIAIHFGFFGCEKSVADVDFLLANLIPEDIQESHFVNAIAYGANSLLVIEEPIGCDETREMVEDRLFLAAKCLTEGTEDMISLSDSTLCQFYCDLPGVEPLIGSFHLCLSKVEEILYEKMADPDLHIPVRVTLTPLPHHQPSPCLDYASFTSAVIQNLCTTALTDCLRLLKDPLIQRIKAMRPYLIQFLACLKQLSIASRAAITSKPGCGNEEGNNNRSDYVNRIWQRYFANGALREWLVRRRHGMAVIKTLLRDINLVYVANADLGILPVGQTRKIFFLKTVKKKDVLLEQLRSDFGQSESIEWSTLELVSSTETHIENVRKKLVAFATEADAGSPVERVISSSPCREDGYILTEGSSIRDPNKDHDVPNMRLLVEGNPSVYLLQPDKCTVADNEHHRWYELGVEAEKPYRHRTLILMGASGSGKSTLVNSIVNYVLCVQWNDPFRFRIDSANSQSSSVTAYTIHRVDGMAIPCSLTIIDTPGYSGNVESDAKTTRSIANFLSHRNSLDTWQTVDAICLVAQSTQKLANPAQNNVIEAVQTLFGAFDYRPKVRWFCTFASNLKKSPTVLETVQPSIVPTNVHYQFDNAVLFGQKRERKRDEIEADYTSDNTRWDKMWANFGSFFSQWALSRKFWVRKSITSTASRQV